MAGREGKERGVLFAGRLDTDVYLHVHMAIGFENKIAPYFRASRALEGSLED